MLVNALFGVFVASLAYVLWLAVRSRVIRSSLDEVAGPPRLSFITGHMKKMFTVYDWSWPREITRKYGGVVKLEGWFGTKWLYVSDPKALHSIVVKDQYVYEETSWFISSNNVIFGPGLLSTLGSHHRKQRKLLNPVFSINHMRDIIPIFYPITHKLRDVVAAQLKENGGEKEIDMLHWVSRAALEFIGQAGLGYSFDDLSIEAPMNSYTVAVKSFFPTMARLNLTRQFWPLFSFIGSLVPPQLRRTLAGLYPSKHAQRMIRIVEKMQATAKEVYLQKQAALARADKEVMEQVGNGKDIMSVLMRANAAAAEEDRLPESEVLGQMNTFLFAGSDTTSSALARILWVLAAHPDVQEKVREEVTEARQAHGDLLYDELTNLPYLDAVCRETLRLYSPVSWVNRSARSDIKLPLSKPITAVNGELINEVAVEAGTHIMIGIYVANRDPAIWGLDADEWKPERWLQPLPKSVDQAHLPGVYSNMMTFLGGGRACIGFKFSQLEMKVVLSVLLESFSFASSGKDIMWSVPGVSSPTIAGTGHNAPHLPLKVSFART